MRFIIEIIMTGQGFVKEHIQNISQVIEKCAENNQCLYIAFIDDEKAFDSVETSAAMQALRNQGVDEPYVINIARYLQRLHSHYSPA